MTSTVPDPEMAPALMACVPPPKASVPPVAVVKLPLLVPPPASESTPDCTLTVPLLLKATPMVVVALPEFCTKVPVLLNALSMPMFWI